MKIPCMKKLEFIDVCHNSSEVNYSTFLHNLKDVGLEGRVKRCYRYIGPK